MDVNLNGNTLVNGYFKGIYEPVEPLDINGASGDPGTTDGEGGTPGTADNVFRAHGGNSVGGYNGGNAGYISLNGGNATTDAFGGNAGHVDLNGGRGAPNGLGARGGIITMNGGAAYDGTTARAGSITMNGGSTSTYNADAGSISMSGGTDNGGGAIGGSINLNAGTSSFGYAANGGSIDLSGAYSPSSSTDCSGGYIAMRGSSNGTGGSIQMNGSSGGSGGTLQMNASSGAAGGTILMNADSGPGGYLDMSDGASGLVTTGYSPQDNAHDGSSSDYVLAYNGTTANGGGNVMVPTDLSTLYAGGNPLSAFLSPANVDSSVISAGAVGNVVNGPYGLVALDDMGNLNLSSNLFVTGSFASDNGLVYTDGAGTLYSPYFSGDGSSLTGYAPLFSVGNADAPTASITENNLVTVNSSNQFVDTGISTTNIAVYDGSYGLSCAYLNVYSGPFTSDFGAISTDTYGNLAATSFHGDGSALTGVAKMVSAPSTSSDSGTAGQVAYDSSYFYVCVATDTWKRVALSTF